MDTKTQKKAKNPKQAVARINTLLRGIDNSVIAINKHKTIVTDAVKEVKTLMGGLSNPQTPTKPAEKAPVKPGLAKTKPAKVAKKPAKPAKAPAKAVKPPKAPKPAKKAPAKAPKPEKKPLVEKTAKPAKAAKAAVSVKDQIRHVLKAGSMSSGEILKAIEAKWGARSRQSLYHALQDTRLVTKHEGKYTLVTAKVGDSEAEEFIKQVENSQAVAEVQ